MSKIRIKKAKIVLNYMEAIYYITDKVGDYEVENEYKVKFKYDVHEDLKKAFDGLKFHLAMLCEMIKDHDPEQGMDQHPILSELLISSFITGGKGDTAGVTIAGRRTLNNGKVINVVCPFTRFDDENSPYDYGYELSDAVTECVKEVVLYIEEKKSAPIDPPEKDPQGSLYIDSDGDLSNSTDDTHEFLDDDEL